MDVIIREFGSLHTGEKVFEYALTNDNGMSVKVLNYGGIIREINVPDSSGRIENIVLGFDDIHSYINDSPYFGCIVGRTAGRYTNGQFELDGVKYFLEKNDGENNLHGGQSGLHKAIWKVVSRENEYSVELELEYFSPHCDGGYPGDLEVKVNYILTNHNELIIEYWGKSSKRTPINLTNHSYFNLSGGLKYGILDHELKISSDRVVELDRELLPTGAFIEVHDGPFDFMNMKKIGRDIQCENECLRFGGGYDHPFVLKKVDDEDIVLLDSKSGRVMNVKTDQPVVVCYCSCQMDDGLTLSGGTKSEKYLGICLETQGYPDSLNHKEFPDGVYGPEEIYTAKTIFGFKTAKKG